MSRWIFIAVMLSAAAAMALAFGHGGHAALQPVSIAQAGARPHAAPSASRRPFPEDHYRILLSRSIFDSGRKVTSGPNGSSKPAAPEAGLSLKGIAEDGAQFTAFVEDASSGKLLRLQVGDAIAQGRVAAMTLHSLDYNAGGKLLRVAVGQSLSTAAVVTAVRDSGQERDSKQTGPRHPFASAR